MDTDEVCDLNLIIKNQLRDAFHFRHRSIFFVHSKDAKHKILTFYNILSNFINNPKPSVLWCHKEWEDDRNIFNLNVEFKRKNKKVPKELLEKITCPLEKFVVKENVQVYHYQDIHKIIGSTFSMLILQDFKSISPNYISQTVEMVEGGGIILFMVPEISDLKELSAMEMDIHKKYKTDSHPTVYPKFNKRFLLSLAECKRSLILSSEGEIHPRFDHVKQFKPPRKYKKPSASSKTPSTLLEEINDDLSQTTLIKSCKTYDQANVLHKLMKATVNKFQNTITLIASRGRGKSASLGLASAYAIECLYSKVVVTSPSLENVKTFFKFVISGLDLLGYELDTDYTVAKTKDELVFRIEISKKQEDNNQIVEYKPPAELAQTNIEADLLIIDEAAAIPLITVKKLLNKSLTFMSSTVCGYEGTGRSLSLKLIKELREQTKELPQERRLEELTLNECIRYNDDDDVEKWIYHLLCLEAKVDPIDCAPIAEDCHLFYVNKESLFSYHTKSEAFLQKIMALYVSAHYRNSPNDLHMLMDAPMHHLFCLLPQQKPDANDPPDPLCVVHISFEGKVFLKNAKMGLRTSKRSDGDLIPWILTENYDREKCNFVKLSGIRIVRIATHPDMQRLGYGKRALQLLESYFNKQIKFNPSYDSSVDEIQPMQCSSGELDPVYTGSIIFSLDQRPAENIDYIGVSYGLTFGLLRFWKKSGYIPMYVRDTAQKLTGEHTCIMIKPMDECQKAKKFIDDNYDKFEGKFFTFLRTKPQSKHLSIKLAHAIITNSYSKFLPRMNVSKEAWLSYFDKKDLKRLKKFAKGGKYLEKIKPLLPELARQYFDRDLDISLNKTQMRILIGLLYKEIDEVISELGLDISEITATISILSDAIDSITSEKDNMTITKEDENGRPLKKLKTTSL